MNYNLTWILFLIMQRVSVMSRPIPDQHDEKQNNGGVVMFNDNYNPKPEDALHNEQVISVRITSSVAIGRGKIKPSQKNTGGGFNKPSNEPSVSTTVSNEFIENNENLSTEIPLSLMGANIEFIKQLNAKKEVKGNINAEIVHPFHLSIIDDNDKVNDDTINDYSTKVNKMSDNIGFEENIDNILLARNTSSGDKGLLNHNERNADLINNNFGNKNVVSDKMSFTDTHSNTTDLHINETTYYFNNNKKTLTSLNEPVMDDKTSETIHDLEDYDGDSLRNLTNISMDNDDSVAESSITLVSEIKNKSEVSDENTDTVPLARSVSQSTSLKNYIHDQPFKQLTETENSPTLTTVNFSILHDTPKTSNNNYFNNPVATYTNPNQQQKDRQNNFDQPKVYSQPAQFYSEPAKFYSEPAKIYSEPAKIYSEPAKVYSEPAKIYSEPAKFYSEPASLHLSSSDTAYSPWKQTIQNPIISTTIINTTPTTANTFPSDLNYPQRHEEHQEEKNYEVDENVSIMTDGRTHGVQESSTEKCKQDNCKVGYVVEGRQYKKYRLEERTPDGFLVGEYGVVRNEDGALRGVRYTADSDASPRLIQDALMKFLQLR